MKNRPVFFDDLAGLIATARLVAKTRNVSLAEASDFLETLLVRDGTVIYTKVAEHQVEELGEAWYAPACDYVSEALSSNWWSRPELLDEPLQPLGLLRDELAISNIDAVRLLEIVGDAKPSNESDFLDPQNPRYSRKLAAAVRAWQEVKDPGKKTPKQALEKWLREHAAEFSLTDDDGNPVNQAIDECSKVANWQLAGGAPKTSGT